MANASHFHQLALFICHLFNDGPFRTAHILYKPNAFDHEFLTQLDLICPDPLPLYLTDVTQPWDWPWNQHDSPDNVLQLNFFGFDPSELRDDVIELGNKGFALYQIYAFSSNDSVDKRQQASTFSTLYRLSPESRVLILNYGSDNVSVHLSHGSNSEINQEPLFLVNQTTDFEQINLFNRTFGEYERMQFIPIETVEHERPFMHFHTKYIGNYYHLHLNNSCIIMDDEFFETNEAKKNNYYKEIHHSLKKMDEKALSQMIQQFPTKLLLFPMNLQRVPRELAKARILYPIHLIEWRAVFVYGTNFERERNIFNASAMVQLTAGLIVLFAMMTAIILWLLRRIFGHARDEFQLTVMDSLIFIVGGGNLQMDSRFERWFFGTLLIGTFFMMAVFGGNLLDCFISVSDAKVRTFDDLAKTNATIIIDAWVGYQKSEVIATLTRKLVNNFTFEVGQHTNAWERAECFAVIIMAEWVNSARALSIIDKRDFDELEESLGEIVGGYILRSRYYIPGQYVDKMDKLSAAMVESGLFQFYMSFKKYQEKSKQMAVFRKTFTSPDKAERFSKIFAGYIDSEDSAIEPFTMKQLKRPVTFVLSLYGIAMVVFLAELVIYKWKYWRDGRIKILPLVERVQESMALQYCSRKCPSAPAKIQQSSGRRVNQHNRKRHSVRF